MRNWSPESEMLYRLLQKREYPEEFCRVIAEQLNTTWTANRMLGYLQYLPKVSMEDIADEMLGILTHRRQIQEHKQNLYNQNKLNELYYYGL